MSYYFKAVDVLLEKFNVANKLNLLPEHVKFINPRPADSVDITMSKVYNTAIDMVMQPGAPFNGVVTLYYNRVDLRVEFSNAKLSENNYVNIEKETTLHEALDAINIKLGTRLTANEIEDMELPAVGLLVPVQLRANDESFEYFGAVDIVLYRSTAKLATIDHDMLLFGFYEEATTGTLKQPFVPLYHKTMNVDYTSARAFLSKLMPSKGGNGLCRLNEIQFNSSGRLTNISSGERLCRMLFNPLDGLNWNTSSDDTLEVTVQDHAWCVYNGLTSECNIAQYVDYSLQMRRTRLPEGFDAVINPANLNYKYVAVIFCNSVRSNTLGVGRLALMHYN